MSLVSIKQEHNLQENSGALIDTSGASFSSTKQCQLGLFITFSPSLAFLSGMKVFFGNPAYSLPSSQPSIHFGRQIGLCLMRCICPLSGTTGSRKWCSGTTESPEMMYYTSITQSESDGEVKNATRQNFYKGLALSRQSTRFDPAQKGLKGKVLINIYITRKVSLNFHSSWLTLGHCKWRRYRGSFSYKRDRHA